ncbi:MAG: 2OG-Fe(II) oxygenase [Limnobacter sp.]|nr:2OG-Fe(II) oxygenase [Limnobacter sp.]
MPTDQHLFDQIASDLRSTGYSIQAQALSPEFVSKLRQEAQTAQASKQLKPAGVGRNAAFTNNNAIRRDDIAWIEGETDIQAQWLEWAARLQQQMNRQLMLGLFSFESHYAHYAPGAFYKKHVDAFKGQANRMLSVVAYLNPNWQAENGGQLVIYSEHDDHKEVARVSPNEGTVVVFLSEEFPHEVLPAKADRYSIAGWYRLNTSTATRVDPPQ